MVKTVLKINGMVCGMCEAHINDCIRRNFSVKRIKTFHTKGESEILSEGALDEDKLKTTIADTGYTLVSMDSEEYVKKGLFNK